VQPVNDRPHFAVPSSLVLVEDAGFLSIRRFAQALSAGTSDDEAWQTLRFDIRIQEFSGAEYEPLSSTSTSTSPSLFAIRTCSQEPQCSAARSGYCAGRKGRGDLSPEGKWLAGQFPQFPPSLAAMHLTGTEEGVACGAVMPHIDREGMLRMRTARDQHGEVRLLVTAHDDGGTAFGGSDTYGPVEVILKVLPQPRVFSIIPRFGATSGGNLVTLLGQFFGTREDAASEEASPHTPTSRRQHVRRRVSVGDIECASTVLVSDSEIICEVTRGIGGRAAMVELLDDDVTQLPAPTLRGAENDHVLGPVRVCVCVFACVSQMTCLHSEISACHSNLNTSRLKNKMMRIMLYIGMFAC
jgi:hypothetical protein